MDLPAVVDVAIALIFIYLTLSLLVSGLQEAINSILELRARNLRKSIRNLLGIEEEVAPDIGEDNRVRRTSNLLYDLYANPLIQGMNQTFIRRKQRHSFGPSYISSDVFANSLLSELGLAELSQKVSEIKLEKFIDRQLFKILNVLPNVEIPASAASTPEGNEAKSILQKVQQAEEVTDQEIQKLIQVVTRYALESDNYIIAQPFSQLKTELYDIKHDFEIGNADLVISISRIRTTLIQYFSEIQAAFASGNEDSGSGTALSQTANSSVNVSARFKALERSFQKQFSDEEQPILLNSLKPNLVESIRELRRLVDAANHPSSSDPQAKDDHVRQAIHALSPQQNIIEKLPPPLARSLEALAERAQRRSKQVELGINEFQQEIEQWFDHSMARASGSYKRHNQLFAFFLGLIIAVFANADTFHVVGQISKNSTLRSALSAGAIQFNQRQLERQQPPVEPTVPIDPAQPTPLIDPAVPTPAPAPNNTRAQQRDVNQILEDLEAADVALPLGWSSANVAQQLSCSPTDAVSRNDLGGVNRFLLGCTTSQAPGSLIVARLRAILGWLPTAIAISMGAPFWFELLGRFVNVRNTGSKPKSTTEES